MSSITSPRQLSLSPRAPMAARAAFAVLRRLQVGTLELLLPDGTLAHFGSGRSSEPRAAMRLNNWRVFSAALRSGDIGLAESYIADDWHSPDLVALLALLVANREAIEAMVYGRWWGSLLHRAKHLLNRNSRRGSRKNIHAHYDLGNAFYRLWLDKTMTYSAAWFEGDHTRPLVDAQWAKVRRALDECGVQPGSRVLEIGCGWGGVAEYAARHRDAHVTGVTLSQEQLTYAQQRLLSQGLQHRADLRLQDYRDVADGPYDAVVSIEMFEAVGRAYWPGFFRTLREQLKPDAKACIQSITIRDDLFERYVKSTDFIQQYIFPGGLLPSVAAFREQAAAAGLLVCNELRFGADYGETLRRWRASFLARETQVRQLNFDTRFMRTWEFYLACCEAAFDSGNTDVVQFTLQRVR